MTAITPNPLRVRGGQPRVTGLDSLLRFALRADATVCSAVGLLTAIAADTLSPLTGLSATAEWISGAALVTYGALLYLLAGARHVRRVGIGVLTGNIAFAVAVGVVLVAGWLHLTGAGVATMLAFTTVTLGIAALQYLGVRRLA